MDAMCLEHKCVDTSRILSDLDEEQKQHRYLELLGHTDNYLYIPLEEWTCEMYESVRQQGNEKESWGCPSYNEMNLKLITSDSYIGKKIPYIKWGTSCPICLEPIISNNNAYYTECSHVMHKTCITNYYNYTHDRKRFEHKSNWNINCPMCRRELERCMWLERQYAMEPWRLENRRKSQCNLDYEFYKDFMSEDILECCGCSCTKGCGSIVGTNKDCKACQMWRYFTLEELRHHKHQCTPILTPIVKSKNERTGCALLSGVLRAILLILSFYKQRRHIGPPYSF
jgi:hypothetical protein